MFVEDLVPMDVAVGLFQKKTLATEILLIWRRKKGKWQEEKVKDELLYCIEFFLFCNFMRVFFLQKTVTAMLLLWRRKKLKWLGVKVNDYVMFRHDVVIIF